MLALLNRLASSDYEGVLEKQGIKFERHNGVLTIAYPDGEVQEWRLFDPAPATLDKKALDIFL
jgi:hypothetical protein